MSLHMTDTIQTGSIYYLLMQVMCEWSQPMKEDVTYVTSSLIGWDISLMTGDSKQGLLNPRKRTIYRGGDAVFNSLAPGKFECNFRDLIFQIISVINGWVISCELALRWMSLDLTDDKSTLVQVMAWCRQETIHYLSQCWLRSQLPYGITKPQWVNS